MHVKIPGFLDMRRYRMVHQLEESFTKETCTCGKHRFKTPGNNSARKERKGMERKGKEGTLTYFSCFSASHKNI
jgi:hypothetical protein